MRVVRAAQAPVVARFVGQSVVANATGDKDGRIMVIPTNQFQTAEAIVRDGFGEFYIGAHPTERIGLQFAYREVFVYPDCDFESTEPLIRAGLDEIGWQLALYHSADESRFKSFQEPTGPEIKRNCNIYGLAPICLVEACRPLVYHVTAISNARSCWRDGIKASDGRHGYPDTTGKIHVCQSLRGNLDSAERWAWCLSNSRGMSPADYSILEIKLGEVRGARVHKDFHSTSGIIIDRIESISPIFIAREFRLNDGEWESVFET